MRQADCKPSEGGTTVACNPCSRVISKTGGQERTVTKIAIKEVTKAYLTTEIRYDKRNINLVVLRCLIYIYKFRLTIFADVNFTHVSSKKHTGPNSLFQASQLVPHLFHLVLK